MFFIYNDDIVEYTEAYSKRSDGKITMKEKDAYGNSVYECKNTDFDIYYGLKTDRFLGIEDNLYRTVFAKYL